MSIDNLEKLGVTRKPQIEQAMSWLVANGPLHVNPQLPNWLLRQLVRGHRIARLRRGVYLAPTSEGRLPSAPAIAQLLAPEGYVSFYGPLTLHGLTDQETARWTMVTREPQASVRLPRGEITFVPWPRRVRNASTRTHEVDGVKVRVATPAQAFIDSLEAPRFAPSASELLHVLRDGLTLGKLSANGLVQRAVDLRSPVVARRLGLLLELATGRTDERLRAIANRSHNWTRFDDRPGKVREPRWRLLLPQSRDVIARAAR